MSSLTTNKRVYSKTLTEMNRMIDETLLNTVNQLNEGRKEEGNIELNENDVEILGHFAEPLNPKKRLILLVKLKTPYLDLLGEIQWKLPFYCSSGLYSKNIGNFYSFFGFMSNLNMIENNNANLKYLEQMIDIGKVDKDIENRLMLSQWMIKCGYFSNIKNLVNEQVFKSYQEEWRNSFGSLFTKYQKKGRLCNNYLKKYSDALTSFLQSSPNFFQQKTEELSALQINEKIGVNSIFGFNLNNAISWEEHKHPIRSKIDTFIKGIKSKIANHKLAKEMTSHPNDATILITQEEDLNLIVDFLNEGSELPTPENIIDYIKDLQDVENTGTKKELRQFLKSIPGSSEEKTATELFSSQIILAEKLKAQKKKVGGSNRRSSKKRKKTKKRGRKKSRTKRKTKRRKRKQ
jgi:hypothetical protein